CSLSLFFLSRYGDHRDLHSFPTRRSSDLLARKHRVREIPGGNAGYDAHRLLDDDDALVAGGRRNGIAVNALRLFGEPLYITCARSEEHTSELQSRENLVCRLLLEKKNSTQ